MDSSVKYKVRNVSFNLLGVILLLLKSRYTGPFEILIHSYLGNISVSFAIYFLTLNIPFKIKLHKIWYACIALTVVELFELFDGFGFMTNVYDTMDLLANLVGVTIAFTIDYIQTRKSVIL